VIAMLRLIATALVFAIAGMATAQKTAGHELGFKPERLYQFGELDSVNMLNGNLTVTLPIGQRYSVGGSFGYQFQLVYNSKVWDYIDWIEGPHHWILAEPNLRSNAGVGWRISLGKLLSPTDATMMYPSAIAGFTYESPYGDEHPFTGRLLNETGAAIPDANVLFSADGRLRLVKVTDTERYIEFPSGEKHTFHLENDSWHLKRQEDRFGNWVAVTYTYDSEGRDATWTISDSVNRTHTVEFSHKAALSDSFEKGQVVDKVTLQSFDGQSAIYSFAYDDKAITYGCGHAPDGHPYENPDTETTKWMPVLSSLDPPGDTGTFSFTYETAFTTNCDQGALKRMTLPTGGFVDYTYQQYDLPSDHCASIAWADLPVGLRSKTTSEGHTWDYLQSIGPMVMEPQASVCGNYPDNGLPIPPQPPIRWARTTVLSPATDVTDSNGVTAARRTRTDHYFDIWTALGTQDPLLGTAHPVAVFGQRGISGGPDEELGSVVEGPNTSADVDVRRTVDGEVQMLTTRTFELCANDRTGDCSITGTLPGRLMRSTYLRWAPIPSTQMLGPRVVTSTSTVYNTDTGCDESEQCRTSSFASGDTTNLNGVGQSRVSTLKSNFPGAEDMVTFTNYPSWTAAELRDTSTKWLFDTYSEIKRTVGTTSERTLYCFSTDGFLERVRTLAGTTPSSTDRVRTFTATSTGEVAFERSYGGDDFDGAAAQDVGSPTVANVFTEPLPASPLSQVNYAYTAGVLNNAAYDSPFVTTVDRTIDVSTGLVTADRDSAGVETTYDYDGATARLKEIDPPGDAVISLTYTKAASSTTGPKVDVVTTTVTTLQKEHAAFDGFGRPRRESRWLPAETSSTAVARWVTTETKYDGLGRKRSISVPTATTGTLPPSSGFASSVRVTAYEYDEAGRPVRIVSPDGTSARVSWTGTRVAQKFSTIAASGSAETEVEVIEHYDAQGRLISVQEGSGAPTVARPAGSLVETSYTYDAGGRLASVDAGEPQERTFTYDVRGFLTSENHPENGTTTYLYDGRGHVRKRTVGGRTLSFTLDAAERLESVAEGSNVLKEFTFGTANAGTNKQQGKLQSAGRRNFLSTGWYDVTETYTYDTAPAGRPANPGGRLSSRTTLVEQISGTTRIPLQTFTYAVDYDPLGMPQSLTMPTCSLNGCSAASGLAAIDYARSGGLLTAVANFAALTYHPSGMVENVTHASTAATPPVDTYSALNGLPRPSAIKFAGGTCPTLTSSPITSAATICAGSTGNTASVTPRANITHSWQISGGTITSSPSGDSISFTAAASGPITLTVTATNSCNESAPASKLINVTAAPAAPVISVENPLCSGPGRTASVQPVTGITYTWFIDGGTITSAASGNQVEFTSPASGSVTLSVTAQNSCGASTPSSPRTVSPIATPSALLSTADTTIVRGPESVELSVSLGGASPRTIVWSDGHQQSNITTSTIKRSVSPDVTIEYSVASVTAGGCSGTVSGTTTVTVIPPAPNVVTATTQLNRTVLVTWAAVAGAAAYRIERAPRVGAATTWSTTTSAASYTDTVPASTSPVTYVYYVRAIDQYSEMSDRGAWDYATAATLLNQRQQIVAATSEMLATDVSELRAGVDAVRAAVALQPSFNGAAPLPGAVVRAADFTTIISAMNSARTVMGRAAFAYMSVPAPAPGGVPLAAHVLQIREALR
jgi:YD repeat-containing protein